METAKIFKNGGSEAVRLPEGYRFDAKEVFIKRFGDMVVLVPKEKVWSIFLEKLPGLSHNFPEEQMPEKPQIRTEL